MGQAPTAVAGCRVEVAVTRVDRRARKLHYESQRAKRRGKALVIQSKWGAGRAIRGVGIKSLGFRVLALCKNNGKVKHNRRKVHHGKRIRPTSRQQIGD